MITLPSCEASRPAPAPMSASAILKPGVVERHVERREHHDRADADRDEPELRDGARRAPGRDPRAQQREDEHRDRQRQQALAGLERVEAQHDLQVHGDDEERAHQDELLPQQRREPGAQLRDRAAASCRAAGRGRGGRAAAPTRRTPASSARPPSTMNGTGEKPSGVISVPLIVGGVARLDEAPHAAAQDREHDQAQAARRQRHADDVEPRAARGAGGPRDLPAQQQDDDHDDGLAGEHVAPRELRRHPAADQRAGGDRDGRDAAEQRVGERALAALVAGGGQRRDRRDHEHRAEPLDPRPADQQHREVRAQRRRQRPDAVDRQADRERAVAAQDVAELRARAA